MGEGISAPCCMVETRQIAHVEVSFSFLLPTPTFSRLRVEGRFPFSCPNVGWGRCCIVPALFSLRRNMLILKFLNDSIRPPAFTYASFVQYLTIKSIDCLLFHMYLYPNRRPNRADPGPSLRSADCSFRGGPNLNTTLSHYLLRSSLFRRPQPQQWAWSNEGSRR